MENQYDAELSGKFADLVETDPVKIFVHYPEALRLLGSVKEKSVLDVGCGGGIFDQILFKKGASITGYDISEEQIRLARRVCKGGNFFIKSPQEVSFVSEFDKAVSILVLHYSKNFEELKMFFSSTFKALKPRGKFVCILTNPKFRGYGIIRYNRRYFKFGNKMKAEFINLKGNIDFSVNYRYFSQKDYELAALVAGSQSFKWCKLCIDPKGIKAMKKNYWEGFKEDCPYIGFIAYKKE